MRKKYIAPTLYSCILEPVSMLALSLEYTDEKADSNVEILSGKSRNNWGDLWKEQ
ncbi:MAG: hypothetical protein IKY73_02750 [Bacteroidaceae bacterium]|nr:hypothetical protein [Bacteroidaceae bacterium]